MSKSRSIGKRKVYSIIREWEASSEPQSAVCARHGLSVSKFKYWRRKRISGKSEGKAANAGTSEPSGAATSFIPLELEACEPAGVHYQIHFPNGVELRVPGSTAASELSELIRLF